MPESVNAVERLFADGALSEHAVGVKEQAGSAWDQDWSLGAPIGAALDSNQAASTQPHRASLAALLLSVEIQSSPISPVPRCPPSELSSYLSSLVDSLAALPCAMGNLFGGHKKKEQGTQPAAASAAPPHNPAATITEHDRAVLQLKVQRDRLHKYTQSIGLVIAREVSVAKELLKAGKKANALLALKRKRYQERLLDRTERQLLNLEDMVQSIQFASMQAEVFAALQAGNAVLNALNAQTKLEDVEALMDDTREAVEYQSKVSELMGAEISQADVDDIESTLAGWEAEDQADALPSVPKHEIRDGAEPEEVEAALEPAEPVAAASASSASAAAPVKSKPAQQREVVMA